MMESCISFSNLLCFVACSVMIFVLVHFTQLVLIEKLAISFAQQGASLIGTPGKFKQNVWIDEGICHFWSSSALPSLTNYSGFML